MQSVQAFIVDDGVSPRTSLALQNGVLQEDARLVYAILNIAAADHCQDYLYSTGSPPALGRPALKGLNGPGAENVYMQLEHTPQLIRTLENLFKVKLKESGHAFLESAGPNIGLQRPQDVIIFVIGGTIYEEARTVALLNQEPASGSTGGARLLLGGTCVHNSASFLEMIDLAAGTFPAAVYEPRPESGSNAPALNMNVGGVSLSLGGSAGAGVCQTSGESSVLQPDGIHDEMRNFLVKQGLDRIGLQYSCTTSLSARDAN